MSKDKNFDPLSRRLKLLADKALEGLAGAELAQLLLITLGQAEARYGMKVTRSGRCRAAKALVARRYIEFNGDEARLHSELRTQYQITELEGDATGKEILEALAAGQTVATVDRKNLYLCNVQGEPASPEEKDVLYSQLFNAAAMLAAAMGSTTVDNMRVEYAARKWKCSRELEMRGLASVVQGYFDGRLPRMWPGKLSVAVFRAIYSVRPELPPVLDPFSLLEKHRAYLSEIDDVLSRQNDAPKQKSVRKKDDGGTEQVHEARPESN
ncbi:hypothetical protein PLCT2_02973 [Planctomycetaceae bacterium]|nr:hypothetical protein PLCT2_02973 [Planctomycetaceae bacterium]